MRNETVREMSPRIGNVIKEARSKKAWTQEHLAQAAGVTERTIQRLERGEVPAKDTLLGVALALGIEIEQLTTEPKKEKDKPIGKFVLLPQIITGKDAIDITWGAHLGEYDHPQLFGNEASVVGGFLEYLKDSGEIGPEIGINYKIESSTSHEQLLQVQSLGFLVFGGSRIVHFTSDSEKKTRMTMATVIVVRKDDPLIHTSEDNILTLPRWISAEPQRVSW